MEYPEIIIPCPIRRSFIQAHPNWIFLYSWDVAGKGALGQCVEAHGEPNAFGIPTRYKGCKSSGYFQDNDEVMKILEEWFDRFEEQVEYIPGDKVIPFPKIGRGASRMFELANKSYLYMVDRINLITYPNIKYIYNVS